MSTLHGGVIHEHRLLPSVCASASVHVAGSSDNSASTPSSNTPSTAGAVLDDTLPNRTYCTFTRVFSSILSYPFLIRLEFNVFIATLRLHFYCRILTLLYYQLS